MLSVFDTNRTMSRREMLRIGGLGLGGLSLSSLLAAQAAASVRNPILSGKSVIFVFQQGGPSQLETFDPKPDAASGTRTVTGTVQTSLPGVLFGDTMQQLAPLADKLAIVRSFQTNNGGHNIQPIVGPDSLDTNIGVHYARMAGATRPSSGMPTNAVLFPTAVASDVGRPGSRGNLSSTGTYGSGYAPFTPGAEGNLQKDMRLNLAPERFFDDRRQLLSQLDVINRRIDANGMLDAMDDFQQQAYELLLGGGVSSALDLSLEDPRVVERYDTARYVRGHNWSKSNRGKRGYYTGSAKTIGKLLLMARRLCEAGCGFVTVHADYEGVWDMHADGNNLNMVEGMQAVGESFDHALAAFIQDTEERGLADKILLVACGEMGRTPRVNTRGGRDHWAKLAPLLMYGGGISPGQVIGQSTRDGAEPHTDPIGPKHLIASILQTLFNPGELRLVPSVPSPLSQLVQAEPIPGLV